MRTNIAGAALTAALLMLLAAWRPVSWFSLKTLEAWSGPLEAPANENIGAIVVLSGGDTQARYRHAAALHLKNAAPVLASVGGGSSPQSAARCSEDARRALLAYGVPWSKIWIDARSANTYDDARFAAETLKEKGVGRVLLVTEAYHVLRASMCFRRQGLEVIAAPCGYRAARVVSGPADWLPAKRYLVENGVALHEWLGIAWYLVNGYL